MKTVRIALVTCVVAMCMASLTAQARTHKRVSKSATHEVAKVAKQKTVTGIVMCVKDAKGVLESVSIAATRVESKDEQKVAVFDGKNVKATGTMAFGKLSVDKIEVVQPVETAK